MSISDNNNCLLYNDAPMHSAYSVDCPWVVEGGKLKGRRDPQLQDRNMNTYKQTLTDNYRGI